MKFNYTRGKEARYMVHVYAWNVNDMYYVHYYKDARRLYESILTGTLESGTAVSIYDIKKDIRKAFYKKEDYEDEV